MRLETYDVMVLRTEGVEDQQVHVGSTLGRVVRYGKRDPTLIYAEHLTVVKVDG